jgi:hypothetical protein
MNACRIVAICSFFVATGATASVGAAPQDPREVEGRVLFAEGKYEEAMRVFATLFAERADPIYLLNIGRCQQKLRRPREAIDAFQEYLRRAKGVRVSEKSEIEGFIVEMKELEQQLGGQGRPAVIPRHEKASPPESEPSHGTAPPRRGMAQPLAALPSGSAPTQTTVAPEGGAGAPPTALSRPRAMAISTPVNAGAGQPAVVLEQMHGEAPQESRSPIYRRWWFWATIGVVATAALTSALLLTGGDPTVPGCPERFTCPR